MALAPRTLSADEPLDDVEVFLEHIWFNLQACDLTQSLAPTVEKLLAGLDKCRTDRRTLARAFSALEAKKIFADDELNWILDQVKAVLIADKSEAGGKLYSETFENKNPAETRKYLLGPQLTTMSLWPGKLAGSSSPEAQALGLVTEKSTGVAQDLLNDIGTAETKRDQFDLVTRAAFIDTCNAAVKLLFGQLSDLALSPPPGTKMPIPPGFVDRFFLRGTSARPPTIKELEKSIERTKTKLQQQEDLLKELKDKDKKEQKAKQDAAMAQLAKKAADAQKIKDDADAALAKLKAEIEKDTPPDA